MRWFRRGAGHGPRDRSLEDDDDLERRLVRLHALPEDEWHRALEHRVRLRLMQAAHDISSHAPKRRRRLARPHIRLIVAMLSLLVLLAVAAGAYAAVSLVDSALLSMPSTHQIVVQNLGRVVDLSQTRCGYTLTIHRVYADRHEAVLGYVITGPAGHALAPGIGGPDPATEFRLADARGMQLPQMSENGPFQSVAGNAEARFVTFYAVHAAAGRRMLDLHLVVPAIQFFARPGSRPSPRTCHGLEVARPAGNTPALTTVKGPFAFRFHVPVTPDLRIARLHDAGRRNGVTVRLTRVEVTPIGVWATMRMTGAVEGSLPIEMAVPPSLPGVRAVGPPWVVIHHGEVFYRGIPITLTTVSFDLPLYNYSGEWTIEVFTRTGLLPPSGPYHLRAPWEADPIAFRFRVP